MSITNLNDVTKCINNWLKIRNDSTICSTYFNTENYFTFGINNLVENYHVYLGIDDSEKVLYVFLLDSQLDNAQDRSKIFSNLIICKVIGRSQITISLANTESGLPPDGISPTDAISRIENWANNLGVWFRKQAGTAAGVFEAYNLPAAYMVTGQNYQTFFALKANNTNPTGFYADLVTATTSSQGITQFYNVVRPVPPFDILPENDFYLLQLSINNANDLL